ncbi:hypothetical protein [Cryptosporangium arvum]|uniref:Uncharacterized protein n=1 Tax=Cryptosporangium arvum DSM 44712 TaxID=927661 RepID=A0A010ZUG7_9ACTN|nr:hypothetical protein [Cryptosporangium arvum]EXG82319.1 hypothetical protein CryarDRAFT_3489 [Cryptosporangium arvum DSM 44712]
MDASIEQWTALAVLLPPAQAEDVVGFRMIGEQEAGVETLVEGLLEHGVPAADNVRAEIAVLAEVWGVRGRVEDALRRARPDPAGGTCVRLAPPVAAVDRQTPPVVVPWLECATCGGVLNRVVDGPFISDVDADRLELIDPDGTWGYEADELWEAFATLHECCDDPDCRLAPWLAWED